LAKTYRHLNSSITLASISLDLELDIAILSRRQGGRCRGWNHCSLQGMSANLNLQ